MSTTYYPLTVGNQWHYRMKDGATYTNSVADNENGAFLMLNSMTNAHSTVRKEGDTYFTDAFEQGNFQPLLKDNIAVGDSWDITFNANGMKSILGMKVRDLLPQKEVEGVIYPDVVAIEAESKIEMNGTLMPLQFFTQYYYASGVGLILTTSSHGDYQALSSYVLMVEGKH